MTPQAPAAIAVGCHIVRVVYRRGLAVPEAEVESRTLPDFLLARIRTIAAKWRDEPVVLDQLRAWVRAERLPGVALWFCEDRALPLPAAEPLRALHTRDPVAGRNGRRTGTATTVAATPLDSSLPEIQRVAAEAGLVPSSESPGAGWRLDWPPLGLTLLLIATVGPLLALRRLDASEAYLVLLCALLIALIGGPIFRARWYVADGLVLVRRWWQLVLRGADPHRPEDTVLIIRPGGTPGWRASLWRGRRRLMLRLNTVELIALLAHWQRCATGRPGRSDQARE